MPSNQHAGGGPIRISPGHTQVISTGGLGGGLGGLMGGYTTTGTSYEAPASLAAIAQTVSVMADGMILIDAGWYKMRIPPNLFKDLVTLATLGLVEKLAPEEDDVTR